MREVAVAGRWPVLLPEHRADRPGWDRHEAPRFESMSSLPAGSTLWDVGAELGDHAAVYASWGLQVVLIEPNPRAWPCITATLEANDAFDRIAGWCWAFAADSTLEPPPADRWGLGSAPWPAPGGRCDERAGMVHLSGRPDPDPYSEQPTTSIDALTAAGMPPPDALTIDVEGAELKVLRGARGTVAVYRPRIWLSVHRALMAGYGDDPDDLFGLLELLGYRGELLAVDHEEHWMWSP